MCCGNNNRYIFSKRHNLLVYALFLSDYKRKGDIQPVFIQKEVKQPLITFKQQKLRSGYISKTEHLSSVVFIPRVSNYEQKIFINPLDAVDNQRWPRNLVSLESFFVDFFGVLYSAEATMRE